MSPSQCIGITDPKTADLLNRQLRALENGTPLEDAIREHELQYVVPHAIAAAFWELHPPLTFADLSGDGLGFAY